MLEIFHLHHIGGLESGEVFGTGWYMVDEQLKAAPGGGCYGQAQRVDVDLGYRHPQQQVAGGLGRAFLSCRGYIGGSPYTGRAEVSLHYELLQVLRLILLGILALLRCGRVRNLCRCTRTGFRHQKNRKCN